MSTEQGNVQPWRENVERVRTHKPHTHQTSSRYCGGCHADDDAKAALDALTTQIEELERERDEAVNGIIAQAAKRVTARAEKAERERDGAWITARAEAQLVNEEHARAEKAERALAENEQAWEDMRAYNIRLEERAREAERALAEIIAEADELLLWQPGKKGYAVAHKRFYDAIYPYRSSEDTSDES